MPLTLIPVLRMIRMVEACKSQPDEYQQHISRVLSRAMRVRGEERIQTVQSLLLHFLSSIQRIWNTLRVQLRLFLYSMFQDKERSQGKCHSRLVRKKSLRIKRRTDNRLDCALLISALLSVFCVYELFQVRRTAIMIRLRIRSFLLMMQMELTARYSFTAPQLLRLR